jgi:hypothetical protein
MVMTMMDRARNMSSSTRPRPGFRYMGCQDLFAIAQKPGSGPGEL